MLKILLVLVLELLLLVGELHAVGLARLHESVLILLCEQLELNLRARRVRLLQLLCARGHATHDARVALEQRVLHLVAQRLPSCARARRVDQRLEKSTQRLTHLFVKRALALGKCGGRLGAWVVERVIALLDCAAERIDDTTRVW